MEFQLSYFKSWKMMLQKCCTQYASKFGKLISGHRTGKGQFSLQSQRKAVPKNVQSTTQLHLFDTLANNAENSPSEASTVPEWEFPDVQAGFRKGKGTRDQITSIHWVMEKAREFQKNIYFSCISNVKAFVWIKANCGKFLKKWEYQATWPASWETCMQVRKQQLELNMEQQTGSK